MADGMNGIMPTIALNGNNDGYNGNWGNWGGALIGGAVGGAVGSAWNNNRWNNGCNNNGYCNNQNATDDMFLMDSLSNLRNETSSIGRDQLMQTMQLQNANCQGFGNLAAAIREVGSQNAVGQCRTEAAVYSTSLQSQLGAKDNTIASLNATHQNEVQFLNNTYQLKSSIDSCCCETQRSIERQGCETRATISGELCATRNAIHQEGEATRALISKYAYEALQEKNCDLKSKVSQLETQQNIGAYITGIANQNRNDMQSMLQTIVGAIGTATASALNRAGLLVRPDTAGATAAG